MAAHRGSDVYADARALAADLGDAGQPSWSQRIEDAIAGGAVATEILMALHWTLGELLAQEPTLKPRLRARAAGVRREIGSALR